MMDRLSPREQRLAALFLLLLAAAAVWLAVIRPIANGFAERALRRDLLLATWQRDERLMGELPSLTRAAAVQSRETGRFRLAATRDADANALLVTRLSAMMVASGGTDATVEAIAAAPGIARARAGCRLDPAQLGAFLVRLQHAAPLLMVDALAIDATTGAGETHPGSLDVHVEISAFYSAAQAR